MTIGELRRLLDKYPDEWLVVMARDAEGNGHSPLSNAWECMYKAETSWCGSVYDDRDIEECSLDTDKMVPAINLTPVN